jgi:hypothetical protein
MDIEPKPAKRIFHDWSWSRAKKLWFWKGQIICRLLGHRVPLDASRPSCGRCNIALEEIYGLIFYDHYSVIPRSYERDKLREAAKKLCNCFPKEDKGELQKFDIPRYVIDEVEQALK